MHQAKTGGTTQDSLRSLWTDEDQEAVMVLVESRGNAPCGGNGVGVGVETWGQEGHLSK